MTQTPLYDALRLRDERGEARFHMPGHKGSLAPPPFSQAVHLDFTELPDTGDLYRDTDPNSPIRKAEALVAQAYGAAYCHFLTGGSTQGIFAMLAVSTHAGDTVIVDRGCHHSVFHAMAILDLRPVYHYSSQIMPLDIAGGVRAGSLADTLYGYPDAKALILTCPTYYGVLSSLSDVTTLCKRFDIPLLVDAAHGAHLPWLDGFETPMAAGASMAVCSAHKTLPALGQGSYLLCSDTIDMSRVRWATSLVGSASPSYLIMASLDWVRGYMQEEGREKLSQVAAFADHLRDKYCGLLSVRHGLRLDPTRLCLYTGDGFQTARTLEQEDGVVCEMADRNNTVLILGVGDTPETLIRLEKALGRLEPTMLTMVTQPTLYPWPRTRTVYTPREAIFAPKVKRKLCHAAGHIVSQCVSPYPPGVPVLAPGERVDPAHLDALAQMGYDITGDVFVMA